MAMTLMALTAATSHATQVVVETKNTSLVLDVEKGRQPQYVYYGLRLDAQELQHLQTPRDGRMDAYPVYGMNCPAEAALAELKASAQRVADVIAAINAIGEVTLDSADAISLRCGQR